MAPVARVPYTAAAAAALLALASIAHGAAPLRDLIAAGLDAPTAIAYRAAAAEAEPRAEARLRPVLAALPRSATGGYAAPAVRYALHQDLSRSYGWHLRGLDPAGEAWNSSSLAGVSALHRMPAAAQATIVELSAEGGFSAPDIATLSATLEFLVHEEARRQLHATYAKLGLPTDARAPLKDARLAVEAYMTSLLLSEDVGGLSREALLEKHSTMHEVYPMWPQMKAFVQSEFEQQLSGAPGAMSFAQAAAAVTAIGNNFGSWQKDNICTDLTRSLMMIEDHGTGRVLLTDFYKAALNDGKWQFQESETYLRQLGALDESSPGTPRVIIPNWVNGRSNCVGSSDFHDVCCVSECGTLLGSLERTLAKPAASPAEVEAAVSALSSPTTAAGRDLGALLRNRLQAIAVAHDGVVPIYGRLFAQWMHHAYPHECPYPHRSGTTKPVNIFEIEQAGLASEEDMKALAARRQRLSAPVHSMPWTMEEELLAEPQAAARPVALMAVHGACVIVAFATMAVGFARSTLRIAGRQLRGGEAGPAKKPRARPVDGRVKAGLAV